MFTSDVCALEDEVDLGYKDELYEQPITSETIIKYRPNVIAYYVNGEKWKGGGGDKLHIPTPCTYLYSYVVYLI